jgi:hypothetical protein
MSNSDTNVATISGTLDAPPRFDTLPSGTPRARFVIETVQTRGRRRIHNYPQFAVHGKEAEQLEQKGLSKGDAIAVEGRLRTGQSNVVVEKKTIVYKKTQEPVEWDTTWIHVERVKTGDLEVADTNVVKISGMLGTEVDFTPTQRGTPRARFVVDMVVFRGQEEIHYLPKVTVYDKEVLAALKAEGLSKGDAIEVEGALQTRLSTVIVEGEKIVYASGKPVRRKIGWITACRVNDAGASERGEESEGASREHSTAGVSQLKAEEAAAAEDAPGAEEAAGAKEPAEAEREEPQAAPPAASGPGPEGSGPSAVEDRDEVEVEDEEAAPEVEPPEEPSDELDEAETPPTAGESTDALEGDTSPGEEGQGENLATKAAMKLAMSEGIDIATIRKGSREDGKIVVADVEIAIEERDQRKNAGAGSGDAAIPDPPSETASPAPEEELPEEDEFLKAAEELGMDDVPDFDE